MYAIPFLSASGRLLLLHVQIIQLLVLVLVLLAIFVLSNWHVLEVTLMIRVSSHGLLLLLLWHEVIGQFALTHPTAAVINSDLLEPVDLHHVEEAWLWLFSQVLPVV